MHAIRTPAVTVNPPANAFEQETPLGDKSLRSIGKVNSGFPLDLILTDLILQPMVTVMPCRPGLKAELFKEGQSIYVGRDAQICYRLFLIAMCPKTGRSDV